MQLHQSTSQRKQAVPPLLQRQHPLMPAWIEPRVSIEDSRVINRLVNNLMYLFNIKEGDYLTFVLGHGECSNNKDAIKYWVLDTLTESPVSQDDVLEHLIRHLKEQILLEVYQ